MSVLLHELIREARRRKGLTQAQVAEAIDCKQSAVSMLENGRPDALAKDKLQALTKLLDVDPSKAVKDETPRASAFRFCPDPDCPSGIPYLIGNRAVIRPSMVRVADLTAVAYCRHCGEVLASACPNPECKDTPRRGAFCQSCGSAYIETGALPEPADKWVRARQEASRNVLELSDAIGGDPDEY